MLKYISTRGQPPPVSFLDAMLNGLAPDGGLYVPEKFPTLDLPKLKRIWQGGADDRYIEIAQEVMWPFVEGCIPREDFDAIVRRAYEPREDGFWKKEVVPVRHLTDNIHVLEQFCGPTFAFKDIAMQLLGGLFEYALEQRGEHRTIVSATSGDTGAAAIHAFLNSLWVKVFMFFPYDGMSEFQRRLMTTTGQPNIYPVVLTPGKNDDPNKRKVFGDGQRRVKTLFADKDFSAAHNLSTVNSINFARIMAQMVYFVTSAMELDATPDNPFTVVIPTGNFGHAYAAYCAKMMGLPIEIVVANNENDTITRLLNSGDMSPADVIRTLSSAMDIAVPSNFERFVYHMLGNDPEVLSVLMKQLKTGGRFEMPAPALQRARENLKAFKVSDEQAVAMIQKVHRDFNYMLEPHGAVSAKIAFDLAAQDKDRRIIMAATAHPCKFPNEVEEAIGIRPEIPKEAGRFQDIGDLPECIYEVKDDPDEVKEFIDDPSKFEPIAA